MIDMCHIGADGKKGRQVSSHPLALSDSYLPVLWPVTDAEGRLGAGATEWLDVGEAPRVAVDLLWTTSTGDVLTAKVQRSNDPNGVVAPDAVDLGNVPDEAGPRSAWPSQVEHAAADFGDAETCQIPLLVGMEAYRFLRVLLRADAAVGSVAADAAVGR